MIGSSLKNYKDENIITVIEKMEEGQVPYTLNDLKAILSEVTNRKMEQQYTDRLGTLIKNELLKDAGTNAGARAAAADVKPEDIPPIDVPDEVMRAPMPGMEKEVKPSYEPTVDMTVKDKKEEKLDILQELAAEEEPEKPRKKRRRNKKEALDAMDTMTNIPPVTPRTVQAQQPQMQAQYQEPVQEYPMEEDYYEFEAYPVLSFVAGLDKVLGWVTFVALVVAALVVSLTMFMENIPIMIALIAGSIVLGTIFLLAFYAAAENISLRIEIERHLRRLDK